MDPLQLALHRSARFIEVGDVRAGKHGPDRFERCVEGAADFPDHVREGSLADGSAEEVAE